jgi:protein O-GlcNAc transferase
MSEKFCGVSLELENKLQHGLAFCAQKAWAQAAHCFEEIVAYDPTHKIAWNNLGNVRDELGDAAAAIAAYERALAIDPQYTNAWKNLADVSYFYGTRLYQQGKLGKALQTFERAVHATAQYAPRNAHYDHSYLQLLLETCALGKVSKHLATMQQAFAEQPDYWPHPYPLLAALDAPLWHMQAAKRHAARLCGNRVLQNLSATDILASPKKSKIRIAYLSSDWHLNPVPQQLLPSIEAHDRTIFEVIGIATDAIANTTPWRKRIESAFDHFYALGHLNDAEIAQKLYELHIDIAIDLSLYMEGGKPLILAHRPCKTQVAFLGYTGTSGAPWIDYLIADNIVIPQTYASFYSEKMIRLPSGYMPDNNERPIVTFPENRPVSRIQHGLPADAFVFCAFSNPYKFTPNMVACWLRLLHAVPRSVLWVYWNNEEAERNIRQAAQAAGLDLSRLVFAKRMDSFAAHLQRYPLADLFLDSFPYNAHVTAADALWAGLPVITLQGQSFASRVASSILTALGLPELITTNLASYEALALELANKPEKLQSIKQKLDRNKLTSPYFNQSHYVRELEAAYRNMLT